MRTGGSAAPVRRLLRMAGRRDVRFLVVGGANTLVGLGLFALFHTLAGDRVPYPLVLVPTYAVGIVIAFTSQRLLVFKVRGEMWRDLVRFSLVQVSALILNGLLLVPIVELTPLGVLPAQIVCLGLVVVGTYAAHALFSFRRVPVSA